MYHLNAASSLSSSLSSSINMAFQTLLVLLHGLAFLVSAATIRASANQKAGSNSIQLLPDIADPASNLVATNNRPNVILFNSSLTSDQPGCLDELGTNLNLTSCRNVVGKIPRSLNPITLGWRGKGKFDLVLPYSYVSGM